MDPSLWPRFFWPEGKYNKNQESDGILQGELLIKVSAQLFTIVCV